MCSLAIPGERTRLFDRASARRIEHYAGVGGKRLGRQRVAGEVAPLNGNAGVASGGVGDRGRGALVAFDCMYRSCAGQGEGEGAEPGEEIEHRTVGSDAGEHLFQEDCFGRCARLKKGARRIKDGDPGQQHPDRAPFHDEHLLGGGAPNDTRDITALGEPR